LLAFTTYGGLIARAQLSIDVHKITGGVNFREYLPYCLALNIWNAEFGCLIQAALSKSGFGSPEAGPIPFAGAGIPMAGVAIVPNLQGGAPRVIVTDRAQYKAFYSFSMEEGFKRLVSITDDPARQFTTSPLALPDGTTVTGMRNGWIRKTQPNMEEAPYPIITYEMLTATPTRHKDGNSFVTVSRNGAVHKISGSSVVTRALTGGESIASAAASCTHVFVSTTNGFMTFDANNMYPIASYPCDSGGGFSSPVIGPGGQVYAIVGQYLFVFKGPPAGDGSTACDVIP
jgi:hypothetical protein